MIKICELFKTLHSYNIKHWLVCISKELQFPNITNLKWNTKCIYHYVYSNLHQKLFLKCNTCEAIFKLGKDSVDLFATSSGNSATC